MISWKHSYNRLNEEYEIAKKKQQALDGLYEKGKISQTTHDSFKNEIAAAIAEIQKQQEDLLTKMQIKTAELHNQIKTLEMLLANYEIQHVTGEIDEATYIQEINLFNNGLETARRELQTIQDAVNQLCSPTNVPASIPEPASTIDAAPAQIPETVEVPTACPPTEVTPSYVVSAPEPIITPTVEAAPIIETPVAIAEAPIAAPEPVAIVEAPIIEQPAAIVEEAPVIEQPVVEAPAVETPVVEAPAIEAPAIETPVIEAPVVEAPAIETPAEAPVTEAAETPVVETATETPVVEAPIEQPAVVEVVVAAPEPTPIVEEVVEEVKVEKSALDAFEVAEPDVVQKELLQAVEEIAENPFPQAPQEAHEEAAKATEVFEEAHPVTLQAAKESLPEASSNNSENKE